LFLLPAILAVVMRATAPDVPHMGLEFMTVFMFIPQGLLPLVGLMYATGMIQDEQEEQTITYLLIRPMSRWGMYLVKLAATLTTTAVLTAAFTAITYGAVYWGANRGDIDVVGRCVKAMGINALAVTAYCSIFGLLSLLTNRTLVVGVIYAALVEGLLANLPFSVRLVTVIYYGRIIAYRTMSFAGMKESPGARDIAADVWQLDVVNDPKLLEHPTVGTCIVVLVVGSIVIAVLGAILCSGREFHVKTPEKG
jgi:ABC-2 type transport system permease protein